VSTKVITFWNSWKASLISGVFLALAILLLWSANAFSQLSLSLSNAYFIPSPISDQIVIVAIDDDSLAEYGRTPAEWSRELYGQLAEIVADENARVLGYDLIFSESTDADEAFAESLSNVRQSDARTRIVLSGAGVQQPTDNLTIEGFPNGLVYPAALTPNDTLREVADYIGYVNAFPDVDSRVRRQPSIIEIDNELNFSFSLTVFFAQRRIPASAISQIVTAEDDMLNLTETLSLSVDERGLWLQNYFGAPYIPDSNTVFPVVSFRDVIEDNYNAGVFNDKIVLVGLIDSLGATDQYPVPSSARGALMSGVEIQANAIETLLQDVPLTAQSNTSQAIMIVGLTLITSVLYNKPRWYWKILLWLISILIFFVIAFVLFSSQQYVVNLFYGGMAISLPALFTVGLEISREIASRRRTEFLLESVVTIAEQQLNMDSILPLIAQDVQATIPNTGGFIRVYGSDERSAPKDHRWQLPVGDRSLDDLSRRAQKNQTSLHDGNQIAVPIQWQGDILGMIAVQCKSGISTQQLRVIEDLADRLAPTLDNIALHRSIDRQNRLLELVLDNSPASIVVIDHAFNILRSNLSFAHWLHSEPDELLQKKLFDVIERREIDEETLEELQASIDKGNQFTLELRDNQQRALRLSAVPLSELGHWVMIHMDITDLVNLNELRTQMIRMASHDLKNPLSRVLGYSELISSSGKLDNTNERFMQHIMNAGDEINQIITDILDLEQLRAGEMERKPASFKNLVREIFMRHEPDKDRKQQTMTLDMIDSPITVKMDYLRLGQAVSNLIGNAIKYTQDEGAITIRIIQPDEDHVQLEVEDNGYGIPESGQEKLFTEFYRVKTKSTRGISGTGLGLSLVKSVAEAHDGDVWVDSVEGEGSTFYLKLPITTEIMETHTS